MKNKPENYIILRSLQRSGTHAISEWLAQDKNVLFHNNISPFCSVNANMNSSINLKNNKSNIKSKLKNKTNNLHVFGIELQNIWYDLNVEADSKQNNILLMRSPVNWFSSFISHRSRKSIDLYLFVQMWKTYAHEFIGKTNYLKNKINIYFDAWVSDEGYRKNVYEKLENLGLNFDYKNTSFISSKGGGSSFSGTSIKGKELGHQVLDRINFLEGPNLEWAIKMSQDEEIKYLQNAIEREVKK